MGRITGIQKPDPNDYIDIPQVGIIKPRDPNEVTFINCAVMGFTFVIQCAILFYHMFSFSALSNKQRLLWIVSYCSLQIVITYLLSMELGITLAFCTVEIIMMWILTKSKIHEDAQDHFIILFAEINVYLWILYGNDLFISITVSILCQFMIATSNTKFNMFQMRSIITYCVIQIFSRTSIPRINRWSSTLFAVYALIPFSLVMLSQKFQLQKQNLFWIIYAMFHILFWIYIFFFSI